MGEGGNRNKGNSQPVYQRGLDGFKEEEQEARVFTLTCQRGGEESNWIKPPASHPWLLSTPPHTPSVFS